MFFFCVCVLLSLFGIEGGLLDVIILIPDQVPFYLLCEIKHSLNISSIFVFFKYMEILFDKYA